MKRIGFYVSSNTGHRTVHVQATVSGKVAVTVRDKDADEATHSCEMSLDDLEAFGQMCLNTVGILRAARQQTPDLSGAIEPTAWTKADAPKAGRVSPALRVAILARDDQTCQYCGTTTAGAYQIEHVVPSSMGGPTEPHNLVVACANCNQTKRTAIWVPRNLDVIADDHQEWRDWVLANATDTQAEAATETWATTDPTVAAEYRDSPLYTIVARAGRGHSITIRSLVPAYMTSGQWRTATALLARAGVLVKLGQVWVLASELRALGEEACHSEVEALLAGTQSVA